jgi:hypothetical protein
MMRPRNGFRFVERRPDIITHDNDVWTFLIFGKPAQAPK